MDSVRLQTENLAVGYNGKALIQEIALSLHPGEIMTLIGPNGAGKSTILKSIIRQLALIRGTVCLDGRDMAKLTERDISRSLSVLMTSHIQPALMTCGDVVATGRYPYTGRLGILTKEDHEKVAQCLELVHASELADPAGPLFLLRGLFCFALVLWSVRAKPNVLPCIERSGYPTICFRKISNLLWRSSSIVLVVDVTPAHN